MVDRLEAMEILLQAVETGSFTAASKALNVPLPTVSRKIADLEAHLGTRLLVRTTRSMALTEAGTAYVAAAKRILDDVTAAERTAAGEFQAPRGELVVTAPVLFGRLHVLPIVRDFLATYSDISIRLLLVDQNLQLIDDHVDLAVRIGVLPDSGLIATRVGSMRTVVCASPGLLALYGEPAAPADLASLPCISFDARAAAKPWLFPSKDRTRMIEVAVAPRLSVTTAEAAIWAATESVGVTRVLHYQCAEAVRAGVLRLVLRDFEPEATPVNLVHAARGILPLKLRAFLDVAVGRLRQDVRAMPS